MAWRNPMWRRYLRFMGPDPNADVEDELRFHIEELERQFLAQGRDPDSAHRAAREQFGDLERTRRMLSDRSHRKHRRAARAEWWDGLWADVRLGSRNLLRQPGFTLVAVATLGLGIGANTAIFSIVNSVLLRPLTYRQPQQLYLIREVIPQMAKTYPSLPVNLPNFRTWQLEVPAFSQIAIIEHAGMVLTGAGDPEEIAGGLASANLFETLGVTPELGRTFRPDEDLPGHDHEVILTDGAWHRRFHGDPAIVGGTITLDDRPYTVVGVLPASFRFPTGEQLGPLVQFGTRVEFFKPLGLDAQHTNPIGEFDFAAIGRLNQGVTAAQALAALNVVQARIAHDAARGVDLKAELWPLADQVVGSARSGLLLLLGGVGAVLLLICVNLANLLVARVPGRMREAAIRTALGASRGRLARQLLTETALLGVTGGVLGIGLAYLGMHVLLAIAPSSLPRVDEVTIDGRVLWFASLVSVCTGLLFGGFPAWRIAHAEPQQVLKAGETRSSESRATRRVRASLIGIEVGLSTVLLIVGGLLTMSLVRVLRGDMGFTSDHVLAADLRLPPRTPADSQRRLLFYGRLINTLQAIPGVRAVGWVSKLPLTGEIAVSTLTIPGKEDQTQLPMANYRLASFDYFKASGIVLQRGRIFNDADRGRNVVVLSQSAADRLWPGEDPIGKTCITSWGDPLQQEVIGVVADVPTLRLDLPRPSMLYLPEWSPPMRWWPLGVSFTIRTSSPPLSIAPAVRRAVRDADPAVAITALRPMTDIITNSVEDRRFQVRLAVVFAACALLLAALGIYGVVAYSVEQRQRELSIRIALGAGNANIRRLVVRQGMLPVAVGLLAGVAGALAAGRFIGTLLFGVTAQDPATIGGVIFVILIVAGLACWLPAIRATRLDPMRAWRGD